MIDVKYKSDAADRYRRAWASYRRRWIAMGVAIVILVPTLLLVGGLLPDRLKFWGLLSVIAVFQSLSVRAMIWRCPRCAKPFILGPFVRNPFARQCLHCGLPKWATQDPGADVRRAEPHSSFRPDPVVTAIYLGWLIGLSCALGPCLLWIVVNALAQHAQGLQAGQVRALRELLQVVMTHSPTAAAASILLLLAARRLRRGRPNAVFAVRGALLLLFIANFAPFLDNEHGWRAMCDAFADLFRAGPELARIAVSMFRRAPVVTVPAGLIFLAWLFYGVGRSADETGTENERTENGTENGSELF